MKHLVNLKILMLTALIIPFMISCGDDDDNGGSNSTNGKRISKIVEETKSSIREYLFTYDDKGRIIEMEVNTNSAKGSGSYKRFIQYGETIIISKVETDSPNNSYGYTTHTYTLSEGRIILDTETYKDASRKIAFEYDNSGYLIKSKYVYDEDVEEQPPFILKWENGNLATYEYNGMELTCWEYTDLPWQKGLFFDMSTRIIPNTDALLASMGYYGKLPKNLVSNFDNITYQYSTSNNLVTKVIKTYPVSVDMDFETCVYNITWE